MGNFKETYLAKLKQMKARYPEAHFEVITATAKSPLAPTWKLLREYKERTKELKEKEEIEREFQEFYEPRYFHHINNYWKSVQRMQELISIAKEKDVFLVCYEKEYPCHRFSLKDKLEVLRTMT